MQSRISVLLAQCSGDPGEAPLFLDQETAPLPYLRVWMTASPPPPPPPPLISRSGSGTEVEVWRGNCERLPMNFPVTKLS